VAYEISENLKLEKVNRSPQELLSILRYGNELTGEKDQAYEELKAILKVPTADEICEALKTHFSAEKNERYKGNIGALNDCFYSKSTGWVICGIAKAYNAVYFNCEDLPADIVYMISSFFYYNK
jgi:hypothetical protein